MATSEFNHAILGLSNPDLVQEPSKKPPTPTPEILAAQITELAIRLTAQEELNASLQEELRGTYARRKVPIKAGNADCGSNYEDRPRIGLPWQCCMALTMFACPVVGWGAIATGKEVVVFAGMTLAPLSFSSGLLLVIADPMSNKNIEYLVAACASAALTGAFGCVYTQANGIFPQLFIVISWLLTQGMLYCLVLARRKIGNLAIADLRNYVYERVFFHGLGSLPPMIYLTAESVKCFLSDDVVSGDAMVAFGNCGAVYFPTVTISFMFALFLYVRLVFVPLSTMQVSYEQVAQFQGLDAKAKVQMVLITVIGVCNLVLFALINEGEETLVIQILHYGVIVAIIIVCLVEFVSMAINVTRRRLSQVYFADRIVGGIQQNSVEGLDIV